MHDLIAINIPQFTQAYVKCFQIVDYGSQEYKRDIALSMVIPLIKAYRFQTELEHGLIYRLAIESFENKRALDALRAQISNPLDIHYLYSHSPCAMTNLARFGYFCLPKLKNLSYMLSTEIQKHSGGSSMNDQVHNVQGNSLNLFIIDKCIDIIEEKRK